MNTACLSPPRACKDRGQSWGAQNRHEGRFHSWRLFTEVKFSGAIGIFSSNFLALTTPSYPDASPSQIWPSPDLVIPTHRTTYPLHVAIKCWRLPSSSILPEPYQSFWCFYIHLLQQRKAPQSSLLLIPNHLSIFHTPEGKRWEQSWTWMQRRRAAQARRFCWQSDPAYLGRSKKRSNELKRCKWTDDVGDWTER